MEKRAAFNLQQTHKMQMVMLEPMIKGSFSDYSFQKL